LVAMADSAMLRVRFRALPFAGIRIVLRCGLNLSSRMHGLLHQLENERTCCDRCRDGKKPKTFHLIQICRTSNCVSKTKRTVGAGIVIPRT
jgi:hypothetical protein